MKGKNMKNKLLVTSALVSMVVSGAALAETKISGAMTLGYKSLDRGTAATNNDGFGRETQINVSKTGDLNNGLKYASGFSLEFDGGSEGSSTSNENVHFNIISGNTTVHFGLDHAPHTSASAAPRVAEHADTSFGINGSTALNSFDYHAGAGMKESFGVALIQKTAVGTISGHIVPNQGDVGGDDQDIGSQGEGESNKSAWNIIYSGNAGVDGLNVRAAYQKENADASKHDGKVVQYGIGYNFGKYALGVNVNDIEESTKIASSANETKSYEYGATIALTKELSAGINYIRTDGSDAGVSWAEKETHTMLQLGYNMGPATVSFSFGTLENANGSATAADVDLAAVRLATAF